MAIVRNTTPSQRFIGDYSLPPRGEKEIPDDVIEKYKASGPGRKRLFDSGMLVIKGKGRVVRMESATTNVAPEPAAEEPKAKPKKKGKGKKE